MALIVEDGTVVANANTFATVEQARDFAAERGVTLPAADDDVEVLLIKAGDYLNSLEQQYSGSRMQPLLQGMCYPRTGSTMFTAPFPNDEIPVLLIKAQCQLCLEVNSGVQLFPSHEAGAGVIKKDKTGPLETEYFEGASVSLTSPLLTAVNGFLSPLLSRSGGYSLTTLRI